MTAVVSPEPVVGRALDAVLAGRADRLTHLRRSPARPARPAHWPRFLPPSLVEALRASGIDAPWVHQTEAAEHAWAGRDVVLCTGTASGKSLGYLMPALAAAFAGGSTLYISPTKALAADQAGKLAGFAPPAVRSAVCDGDTPLPDRDWARRHADVVLTNPDFLHHSLLPGHERWGRLLGRLSFIVVDECHHYRGVFGSHLAAVLRRLSRVARHFGSRPVFILASATVAEPEASAARLIGRPVVAVTDDGSPRGESLFGLWQPPLEGRGRRSATAEAAELLGDLVAEGVQSVAFVRSRRGAEALALSAQRRLEEHHPGLGGKVAAYRGGYLVEDRRSLEAALRDGRLLGVAATSALELGVDVHGLDAVLLAGFPGTRASALQQAGRAGRAGQGALAVLVARDDPLDTYLVHHPESLLDRPTEATVFDPDNEYVLAPHLAAAAAELPLDHEEVDGFGPTARAVVSGLAAQGLLRRRRTGWYWSGRGRATDLTDLRGSGGPPVRLVESGTGRLLGTVDAGACHVSVHPGAVYLHRGETYLVRELDLDAGVALVAPARVDYTTSAREVSDLRVLAEHDVRPGGPAEIRFGEVEVTRRVVSFSARSLLTGEYLGETPLDLPERRLLTRAVWWRLADGLLAGAGLDAAAVAGATHAAEHAAIGLLPLFATCDRWDIGGLSTPLHRDTGAATVFVYDGYPGGAGFAARGFRAAPQWLAATRDAVASCPCADGCPSCIHSPKCGNGNEPLDKAGSVRLLSALAGAIGAAEVGAW
jgi:DEAD/DEAH box helicase domain-containing protein